MCAYCLAKLDGGSSMEFSRIWEYLSLTKVISPQEMQCLQQGYPFMRLQNTKLSMDIPWALTKFQQYNSLMLETPDPLLPLSPRKGSERVGGATLML